jgi:hypothetical protein
MKEHKNFYIIVITIVVVFVFSLLGIYKCPSYYILGIPCPTCGITRAFASLLLFDLKKSFYYNALWVLVIIGFALYVLIEFNYIKISKKHIKILIYTYLIIFVSYYIIRNVMGCSVVEFNLKKSLLYKIFNIFID